MEHDDSNLAIEVKNIYKEFILLQNKSSTLKQAAVNMVKKNNKTIFKVLNDISFKVEKGDFIGIVGRNGSGKSTLLKIIAGVYEPTAGNVYVYGKLIPFIELGVGFNPELSGRDNVFLNGAMLGFTRKQMSEMYDEIVAFAELEPFMDQKLKNYSSGMQVRLAFSIAIKAQGDILVLDEVLAVGDEAFQRKCYSYFSNLKKENKTVILVTHSMDVVQQFCNKAIIIDSGSILLAGSSAKVAQKYRDLNAPEQLTETKTDPNKVENKLIEVEVNHEINNEEKEIIFNILIKPKVDLEDPIVTFGINRDNGEEVYRWVTDEKLKEKIIFNKNKTYNLKLSVQNIFPDGDFSIQLGVKKRDRTHNYVLIDDIDRFRIITKGKYEHNTRWKPKESCWYNWK